MNKLIYAFPLALIGAFLFASNAIMAFGMVTVGALVAAAFGLAVVVLSKRMHKAAGKTSNDIEKETAHFRAASITLCGYAIGFSGVAGNLYLAAVLGLGGVFIPFILMIAITALFAAAGFSGYTKGPSAQ